MLPKASYEDLTLIDSKVLQVGVTWSEVQRPTDLRGEGTPSNVKECYAYTVDVKEVIVARCKLFVLSEHSSRQVIVTDPPIAMIYTQYTQWILL